MADKGEYIGKESGVQHDLVEHRLLEGDVVPEPIQESNKGEYCVSSIDDDIDDIKKQGKGLGDPSPHEEELYAPKAERCEVSDADAPKADESETPNDNMVRDEAPETDLVEFPKAVTDKVEELETELVEVPKADVLETGGPESLVAGMAQLSVIDMDKTEAAAPDLSEGSETDVVGDGAESPEAELPEVDRNRVVVSEENVLVEESEYPSLAELPEAGRAEAPESTSDTSEAVEGVPDGSEAKETDRKPVNRVVDVGEFIPMMSGFYINTSE